METLDDEEYGEDDIIEEDPEYSPKSDFSKGKQVDDAVRRCIEARGQEMKAGFWNTKLTKDGQPVKEWKPDTRKQFISTVVAVRYLLNPEVQRNKAFQEKEKDLMEEIETLKDYYSYEERRLVMKQDGKTHGGVPVWVKSGLKYLPDIGAMVTITDSNNPNHSQTGRGLWDDKVNAYWDDVLQAYDELFGFLIDLIDNLNYFKQKLVYG